MKIFYDLNIPDTSKAKDILRYVRCGYTRLAINRMISVNEFSYGTDKKMSKENKNNLRIKFQNRLALPDFNELINDEVKEALSKMNNEIKMFTRITLISTDKNQFTFFWSEFQNLLTQFDIIAVDARDSDVVNHAVNSCSIELITFDLSYPITTVNRQIISRCQERAVGMEINLSAALATTHGRVNTVRFIKELELFRCSAVLTVTSGAKNAFLVRNYMSLSCVLSAMGLPDKNIKDLNNNSDKAILRGLARKHTVFGAGAIHHLNQKPGVISVKVIKRSDENESSGSPDKKKIKLQTESCVNKK